MGKEKLLIFNKTNIILTLCRKNTKCKEVCSYLAIRCYVKFPFKLVFYYILCTTNDETFRSSFYNLLYSNKHVAIQNAS